MDNIKEINEKIFNYTKEIFGDDLLALVLAGSNGKGKAVDGWSDIDYLLVVKSINRAKIQKLQQLASNEPIHIGLTILTAGEISQGIAPTKDIITLYEISHGYNKVLYLSDEYKFPKISKRRLWDGTNAELGRCIKALKTKTYTNYRECFKQLVLLKKLILRTHHIIAYDIDQIDQLMSSKLRNDALPLVPLFESRDTLDVSELNKMTIDYLNIWEAKWSK